MVTQAALHKLCKKWLQARGQLAASQAGASPATPAAAGRLGLVKLAALAPEAASSPEAACGLEGVRGLCRAAWASRGSSPPALLSMPRTFRGSRMTGSGSQACGWEPAACEARGSPVGGCWLRVRVQCIVTGEHDCMQGLSGLVRKLLAILTAQYHVSSVWGKVLVKRPTTFQPVPTFDPSDRWHSPLWGRRGTLTAGL